MADAGEGNGQIMGGFELNRIRPRKSRKAFYLHIADLVYARGRALRACGQWAKGEGRVLVFSLISHIMTYTHTYTRHFHWLAGSDDSRRAILIH